VLSDAERRNAGIEIATAGSGSLAKEIRLPGEVLLNRERVAHVVPQIAGIALDVRVAEGDTVAAGDVLATLNSTELGEAKLDYLTKTNEVLCCDLLLPRAKTVHDNTVKLLGFLNGSPSLEALRAFDAGEAGENLTALVSAYAELVHAKQSFEREEGLYKKQIGSEQEYLAAKTKYEKAAANNRAVRDSVAFAIRRDLSEAEGERRAAKFAARTAEQRLRIMGLADKDIRELDALVRPANDCKDPNCTDCKPGATEQEHEHYFGNGFTKYEVRAPIAGQIVARHVSRGEKIGDDSDLFTIADTSSVWVDLTVYLKDLHAVRAGDELTIQAEHSDQETHGTIAMVSPVVDRETRTAKARVVLDNAKGDWRPGMFVVGLVRTSAKELAVAIPKHAVQTIEGKSVVFVPEGDAFEAVPVQTGRSDRERVEIVAGLEPGARFVANGAFELKAKLVTSSLGSHAGHGH
jgi:multidrug efflux pump subunit AcrA (membrane-fusion protein)